MVLREQRARTYYVYLNSAPDSDYNVTGNADSSGLENTVATAPSPSMLGGNWSLLGTYTLAAGDPRTTLTISYAGTGTPAGAVCLLEQTSTTVYDTRKPRLSQTDAMGDVTAYSYDNLGRPLTTGRARP